MRLQLFDYVIPVAPPPRLQPNIFARIARSCYLHSTKVVLVWLVICASFLSGSILNPNKTAHATLEFSGANAAAKNLSILDQQFPNLNALMTIILRNDDPAQLKLARVNLIYELEAGNEAFALVLAPGTSEYYQNHAIFYYPLNEVKARIDYALSLKPLFAAVATSPTTESLGTLVNEVSASITLGRDPQGLDAMFDESASAVQSLMHGNDRHVDWSQVAGLNFDPIANEAVVLALPKTGMNVKAGQIAKAALAKIAAVAGTETAMQQNKSATSRDVTTKQSTRALPFMALAAIFVGFIFFATIGRLNLALMILLPVLVAEIIAVSILQIVFAEQVWKLWPVFLGIAICGLQISARLAFAILETLAVSVSKQSAVMLAFQKQGSGVVWLSCLTMMVWCGWLATAQAPFVTLALGTIVALLAGLCASFTFIPALADLLSNTISWRAADWFLPIYQTLFANRKWRAVRKYAAALAVVAACYSVYFAPALLNTAAPQVDRNQIVNLLVQSEDEAKTAIEKLNAIPQAQSARWLGAFLPEQADEKLQELLRLQKQFPHFKPLSPQDPAILRDQITSLLVSLEEIATSSATRPVLQKAAYNFRRNLEILSNTTSNGEVLEFENRIFGAFNLLADRADILAAMGKPQLETLDPKLKALFVSDQNIFRIEVSPMKGTTPAALAHLLAAKGFAVAHPALQADSARQVLLATSALVLTAMLLLGLLTLVFAIREISGSIASLATCLVVICTVFGVAELWRVPLSQVELLQATALLAALLVIIATAFLKRQITDHAPPDALHAAEAWLPTMVIAAVAAPAGFLNFTPWAQDLGIFAIALCVITSTIALLLRPLTINLRRYGL